jgi:hypothetical protein
MGIPIEDASGRIIGSITPQQLADTMRSVEVTLENLRDLANTAMPKLVDETAERRTRFAQASASTGGTTFGDTPPGRALAQMHQGAYDVFEASVRGIERDLETLMANLKATIRQYENSDDGVRLALSQLQVPGDEQSTYRRSEAEAYSKLEWKGPPSAQ